jgi:hypothetical protein
LPEHSLSRVVVPATLHSVTGTTTLDREWLSEQFQNLTEIS